MESSKPVRLAYTAHEPAGGLDENLSPIIYLHGLTGNKESWDEVPQIVADVTKRMSYSLDARNHGDSEWSDDFSFDLNAVDVIHFMDSRGIKKAIIVGHSMGGATAARVALKMPDRVEKIVVEDMTVRKLPQAMMNAMLPFLLLIRKALQSAPTDIDEDEAKKFIARFMFSNIPPELEGMTRKGVDDDLEKLTRFIRLRQSVDGRYSLKCNLDVIERGMRNVDSLSSDPEGTFDGPACFIYGKLSPFAVGADEEHIKQFFPNATLEGIDDVAHDVHFSKLQEFIDTMLKFIS